MALTAVLPAVPLLIIVGTDVWVYRDGTAKAERGTPVTLTFGAFRLTTPAEWALACTLAWVVFFPLYLIGRRGL